MKCLKSGIGPVVVLVVLAVGSLGGAQPRATGGPDRRPQQWTPRHVEGLILLNDVVFGKGGERDLKMNIAYPEKPAKTPMPVIVWVHGGGWRNGSYKGGIRKLLPYARRGYFCASIEYRLSGEAIFPAQIEDCKCAIRYVRAHAEKYSIDPDRIGVWGSSAGGHLVAMLGVSGDVKELEGTGGWPQSSSRVQAVCNWYGPSDLISMIDQPSRIGRRTDRCPEAKLIGGAILENKDKARAASPATYVTKDDPPFLIMHGTKDPVVPYPQSTILRDALKKVGVPVELVTLEGAGHGDREFMALDIQTKVGAFFEKHLRK